MRLFESSMMMKVMMMLRYDQMMEMMVHERQGPRETMRDDEREEIAKETRKRAR